MLKKNIALLLFVLIASMSFADHRVFLGSRSIEFRGDRDVIEVPAHDGYFRRVQLHVIHNWVHISHIIVHFGNGQTIELAVHNDFAPNTWSRQIDLPGNRRVIKRVVFFYKTVGSHRAGKAVVRFYGIR